MDRDKFFKSFRPLKTETHTLSDGSVVELQELDSGQMDRFVDLLDLKTGNLALAAHVVAMSIPFLDETNGDDIQGLLKLRRDDLQDLNAIVMKLSSPQHDDVKKNLELVGGNDSSTG